MGEEQILQGILDIKSDMGDIREDIGNINGTLATQTVANNQRFNDIHGRIKRVEQTVDENDKRLDMTEKFNIGMQGKLDNHTADKESHYNSEYNDTPIDRIKRHKNEIGVTGGILTTLYFTIEVIIPWMIHTYGG